MSAPTTTMTQTHYDPHFVDMMRGTPPPTWESTCLNLEKKLADSHQHVTELENRLRTLWDKYDGERKHYMDRIKRLEKELTDTKRKQSVLVSDVVLYEDRGERIKQMEEVGDEMLNWLTDDSISVENLRLIANAWRKAKEDKL